MGILSKLFNKFAESGKEEALEYDTDGKPLYAEDIVAMVKSELEKRRADRSVFELQWQLNTNFLYGNQHCGLNLASKTIEQYEMPEGMENETYNQIEPLARTRRANLGKITYAMTVKPRTSESDDISKAKVSTALLRYKQNTSDFEQFKDKLLDWSELLGSCYVLSWWDSDKGDLVGEIKQVEVDELGNAREYTEQVFTGDVNYGLLSPYEVFPESMYKQEIADQRNIITEQVLSVEDIYDLYGIVVEGKNVDTYSIAPVDGDGGFGYVAPVATLSAKTVENAETVITWYERPGRRYPGGRLIIVIGDELFHYGELPYEQIPIIACKSDDVSGQFYGRSFIQSEIPLQRAYNGMMNTVHDYAKRLALSKAVVEEGAVDDYNDFCDKLFEPGVPVTYKTGFRPPTFMDVPDFPSDIYNQLTKIRSDMEYVAGVSQMMVYGSQNGVTSGKAIQNLTEIDNTRLSITGDNMRNCIIKLAKLWLSIYKKHVSGYRVLRIVGGNDAGDALVWTSEDINSYDICFDAENELIYSVDSQAQNFINALNTGLLTDERGVIPEEVKARGRELLRINGDIIETTPFELHRNRAKRENTLFKMGIPPVIMALDDHKTHYEEHIKEMLQYDYLAKKKEMSAVCEQFENHIREHQAMMRQTQMNNQNGGNNV